MIIDDTVVSKIFKKDSSKKVDVDLIIEYALYLSRKLQTIPQILSKYIPLNNLSSGKLCLDNVLDGDDCINYPEIEDWTEDECILTLANTISIYCDKVWIISDKDYNNVFSKDKKSIIQVHNRVQVWKISEMIGMIKADQKFMQWYEERKKEEI